VERRKVQNCRFFGEDNANEGCGASLCYAKTGLSGSTKFAIQWKTNASAQKTDGARAREFQVIEITDANLNLVNLSSVDTDDAVGGYTDIVDMTATATPASAGSILLMLGNCPITDAADATAIFTFEIDAVDVGPELAAFTDAATSGDTCGVSMMWAETGHSGSTDFAWQWDEVKGVINTITETRTFQVIEITANANILIDITSKNADTLEAGYTQVVDLTKSVTVGGTGSILIFSAGMATAIDDDSTDECGYFQFTEGGTNEGPEISTFHETTNGGCSHSLFYAVKDKSAGSHTFTVEGQNEQATYNCSTDRLRSFCMVELTAAAALIAPALLHSFARVRAASY